MILLATFISSSICVLLGLAFATPMLLLLSGTSDYEVASRIETLAAWPFKFYNFRFEKLTVLSFPVLYSLYGIFAISTVYLCSLAIFLGRNDKTGVGRMCIMLRSFSCILLVVGYWSLGLGSWSLVLALIEGCSIILWRVGSRILFYIVTMATWGVFSISAVWEVQPASLKAIVDQNLLLPLRLDSFPSDASSFFKLNAIFLASLGITFAVTGIHMNPQIARRVGHMCVLITGLVAVNVLLNRLPAIMALVTGSVAGLCGLTLMYTTKQAAAAAREKQKRQ